MEHFERLILGSWQFIAKSPFLYCEAELHHAGELTFARYLTAGATTGLRCDFWFAWNVHGFTLHTVKCVFHNQLKAILQRFWHAACLQMAYFSIKWHGGTESWHIWCNVMVASLYHWTVSNGLPLIQDTPVRQSSYKENHFRLLLTSFSFPTHCLASLAL